eukprot:1314207-Amphidinium_carterae.1
MAFPCVFGSLACAEQDANNRQLFHSGLASWYAQYRDDFCRIFGLALPSSSGTRCYQLILKGRMMLGITLHCGSCPGTTHGAKMANLCYEFLQPWACDKEY